MNQFDMTAKVAIITGSSRGIGQAIAEDYADHGAKVVITSRNIGPCEEVAAVINAKHPGAAIAVASSLSSKESLQAMIDAGRAAFGQIDVLVCNAASNPHYGPMETITDEAFRKTLDLNIVSQHWLITMVAPEMRARKSGNIICVSSIMGHTYGWDEHVHYSSAKAGVVGLVRGLAVELARDGIRVNGVAPGYIRTAQLLSKEHSVGPDADKCGEYIPMGRIGEPDDIADVIHFLASNAARYMTGQVVVVDGGLLVGRY